MSPTSLLRTLVALVAAVPLAVAAATGPYDERADARADIASALAESARTGMPVLVVFGANWCADCKILDMAFREGAAAPLVARRFKVVKVDVGRFDRNVDLAAAHGVALKSGIPAVAVLAPDGRVVYATKAGELADARNMGDRAIYDFFDRVAR
ncbi:MAG TPA: thioredoxin family protein [Casimicrobiaceae bacterium]|mgnify:CR=1 FL=1|nr:thioredoxin family protein [Casimicrobiaceae bacterium]